MLLFGGHGREDDARAGQTHVLSVLLDVGLADGGEPKKPQHAVGHTLQDLQGTFKASFSIRTRTFIFGFMCTVDGKIKAVVSHIH